MKITPIDQARDLITRNIEQREHDYDEARPRIQSAIAQVIEAGITTACGFPIKIQIYPNMGETSMFRRCLKEDVVPRLNEAGYNVGWHDEPTKAGGIRFNVELNPL